MEVWKKEDARDLVRGVNLLIGAVDQFHFFWIDAEGIARCSTSAGEDLFREPMSDLGWHMSTDSIGGTARTVWTYEIEANDDR